MEHVVGTFVVFRFEQFFAHAHERRREVLVELIRCTVEFERFFVLHQILAAVTRFVIEDIELSCIFGKRHAIDDDFVENESSRISLFFEVFLGQRPSGGNTTRLKRQRFVVVRISIE